jgi:hypothetical protein
MVKKSVILCKEFSQINLHGPTAQNKHGAHNAGLVGSDEK